MGKVSEKKRQVGHVAGQHHRGSSGTKSPRGRKLHSKDASFGKSPGTSPRQGVMDTSRNYTKALTKSGFKAYKPMSNVAAPGVEVPAAADQDDAVAPIDHPLASIGLKPVGKPDDLLTKVIVLEGPGKTAWRLPRGTHSRKKGLSAAEKRRLGIGQFPKGEQRYDLFLPLHDLWTQYMADLLSLNSARLPQIVEAKLLKADYHGCLVTVAKSRCPSYVGVTGIILQELQNVFKIITPENRVKVIPKPHSVFTFELAGLHVTLYGNQLCCRASERSAKKFKAKPTIDL